MKERAMGAVLHVLYTVMLAANDGQEKRATDCV